MSRNFFTDNKSIRTVDLKRVLYIIIAITFFIITEIGRNIYRPYIYSNNINDLGLADSIGNLGGIVVQIFLMVAVFNSPTKKALRVIGFLVIGYILYEILQPYLPRGVFDWKDIYGTLLGGAISLGILWVIHSFAENKIIHRF